MENTRYHIIIKIIGIIVYLVGTILLLYYIEVGFNNLEEGLTKRNEKTTIEATTTTESLINEFERHGYTLVIE